MDAQKKTYLSYLSLGIAFALILMLIFSFFASPRYTLLRLGWAINHQNPDTFFTLVDLDRIVADQSEPLLNLLIKDLPALPVSLGRIQLGAGTKEAIKTLLEKQVRDEIKKRGKELLPSSFTLLLGTIKKKDTVALVTFKTGKSPLKIGMRKDPRFGWRVVSVDLEAIRRLIREG
jgi:hypothetical protein